MGGSPDFEAVCRHARSVLAEFGGYFIERISFQAGDDDRLLIQLQEQPGNGPDCIIELCGLKKLSIGDTSDLPGAFVDEIELTYIPQQQDAWPDGLMGVPQKLPTLPNLAWIHFTGPLELDVVASIVQVYVSSDPPAAALGSG